MIDDQGTIVFWNPAAENLFGYSKKEAMGLNLHSLTAPSYYHDRIKAGFKKFAQTGDGPVLGKTTEIEATNRKGEIFPVEVTLSSFQYGGKWYSVGTVRDITERKNAEEKLRQSREDFRIIADYTYNWEAWHNEKGDILWMNPAVERVTGYTTKECLNMADFPRPLIHPKNFKLWQECLQEALDHKQGTEKVLRIKTKKGDQRFVSLSWNPVYDQGKTFTGFRTSVQDITERKMVEDQLRFTQYTVDMAVQSIFWVDPASGRFVYVNDAAAASLGYSKKQFLEMKVHEIDLDYQENNFDMLVSSLRKNKVLQAQGRHRAQSGEILDVELSLCLLTHNQQEVIIVFAKDVTRQKKAERMLKESQSRLDMALTASNTGLWDWHPQKDLHYHSDQYFRQLGYTQRDFQGVRNPLLKMMHPEDVPLFEKGLEKYTSGRSDEYKQEFRLRARDGSYRWILSRGRVLQRDSKGKILRILGVHLDITERKKAEQKLKDNLDELERFNRLVIGREEKMIDLKQEVNNLLGNLGQGPKYKIVH
jgi:PAS domain S-box-containing protein